LRLIYPNQFESIASVRYLTSDSGSMVPYVEGIGAAGFCIAEDSSIARNPNRDQSSNTDNSVPPSRVRVRRWFKSSIRFDAGSFTAGRPPTGRFIAIEGPSPPYTLSQRREGALFKPTPHAATQYSRQRRLYATFLAPHTIAYNGRWRWAKGQQVSKNYCL
jgi:hypothetical protein